MLRVHLVHHLHFLDEDRRADDVVALVGVLAYVLANPGSLSAAGKPDKHQQLALLALGNPAKHYRGHFKNLQCIYNLGLEQIQMLIFNGLLFMFGLFNKFTEKLQTSARLT